MTKNSKEEKDAIPARKIAPVLQRDFKRESHAFTQYSTLVPAGTTEKDLTDPKLWAHVAASVKAFDQVRVVEENGAFLAELVVVIKLAHDVKMRVLHFHELDDVDYGQESESDKYKVMNRGAIGWCVVDVGTNINVARNLETQAAAIIKRDELLSMI